MKHLSSEKFNKAREFVTIHARPLDLALYNYYFKNQPLTTFLDELHKFQNKDGGFAYGLEPDIRTPVSNNISTTFAFQYLSKVGASPKYCLDALDYFSQSYSEKYGKWLAVTPEVNDSPHAIWWQYDESKQSDDSTWGNPTVEILGYLQTLPNNFDSKKLIQLRKKALMRLFTAESMELHEIYCYQRLMISLTGEERASVEGKLINLISDTVEKDPTKWGGYVARPLNFVDSPDSPFYQMLKDGVQNELDYLIEQQNIDGAWYPNWEWPTYKDTWEKVKLELAGKITVDVLQTLKRFGRI